MAAATAHTIILAAKITKLNTVAIVLARFAVFTDRKYPIKAPRLKIKDESATEKYMYVGHAFVSLAHAVRVTGGAPFTEGTVL